MAPAPATLSELLSVLNDQRPDLRAVFHTADTEIGPGYHVTELKLADIESVDCGGRRAQWSEAQLQLLDGQDGERLTVGKVASILQRSLAAIPRLADAPMSVEFAPGNRGLGRYRLGKPLAAGEKLLLPLVEDRAQCKPAVELSCCGAGSACCA